MDGLVLTPRKTLLLPVKERRSPLDSWSRSSGPLPRVIRKLIWLFLTACETAAGDDRATLGLAGVAIRAGARSAIANPVASR